VTKIKGEVIKLIRSKLAAAVFLLIAILVLPGCIALAIDTEINPDGSGTRRMDVAIEGTLDELLKTAAIQQGEPTFEDGRFKARRVVKCLLNFYYFKKFVVCPLCHRKAATADF
jgi:hypothetical protein